MSEAGGSISRGRLESCESEMICAARDQEVESPFIPLKRKFFDGACSEWAPEHHPPSKVCVTEELMATYLQHLKLSSSSSPPSSSTSDLLNDHMLLVPEQEGRYSDHNQVTQQQQQQHQLNIKVVTSCPQSEESRLSRKRFSPGFGGLEEEEEEEEEVVVEEEEEGSGSEVDWSWSPGSKRARSEVDEVILQPTRSQGAELELLGQHSGGGSVLMSVSRTTASDLSSIPEEDAELLGQQTSATRLKGDGEMSSEIEKMQLASLNSSSSSSPSPSSDTVPEPLSSPPTLSPVSIESSSQDHCSIWVAPELKAMTSHNCPIPISIMKEISTSGMQLVPWVDRDRVLKGELANQKEEAGGNLEGLKKEEKASIQEPHNCNYSKMELN